LIWQACNGEQAIQPMRGQLYRLVESQQQVATMSVVDTLEEQALLEELLDDAKPAYPEDLSDYRYLLKTPFRYPPLQWGSRFGRTSERGIFYAARNAQTTLAECAYYRLVFWHSMQTPDANTKRHRHSIRTEHTMFCVDYNTDFGVALHSAPFDQHSAALTHPSAYTATQQLGTAMREANVQAFEYTSARDPDSGHCAGLFSTAPFVQKKPVEWQQWYCEVTADRVSYKPMGETTVTHFEQSLFLVDDELPIPAS
jgi:hypothetical protein